MINTDFLNNSDFLNNFDFLNNLHFIRPEWFYSAIPLLVLYVWLRTRSAKYSGWQSVIPAHLYNHMVVGKVEKGKRPPLWLLPFTWCIAVVALAGPTWERLPQPVYQLKMGHVVVIDMSMSMRATDMTPDRLTRAKYKAIDLVNTISEGEMGLVAYAGDAFVISPLTEDAANITSLLPSLSPEIMPVPGSDPLLGIEAAVELLTNAGFNNGAIYWITDGIEFGQQQELQEYVSGIPFTVNALTVGSAEGAPIRQLNGELLKDTSGSIVVPKLKEDVIRGVIRASGGQLESFTSNDDDIEALSTVSLLERDANDTSEEESDSKGDQWKEAGPYLILLILPFAAFAFRRGLLFFVIVGVLTPFDSQVAHAQTSEQTFAKASAEPPAQTDTASDTPLSWWQTPFLNADQEGLNSYQQAQFKDAAEQFEDNNWKASSLYKAGRFEEALAAYQDVPGIDSLYNQGNALAKLGKLEAAIQKYDEVLEQQPEYEDAEANKSLLEDLLNQQQQKQEQGNQESGQQEGDQSEQDQQQGDQQGQQGEQSQGSENENNSENENSPENKAKQENSDQSEGSEQDQGSEQSQQQNNQQSSDEQSEEQKAAGEPSESEDSSESNQQNSEFTETQDNQADAEDIAAGAQEQPLTDAEKEEMQRMENLMRRVPDDPAFLLKRKMQLEAEKRKRQRMPSNRRDW